MKVLWVSHFSPYPAKGGAFQRSFNMLRELSKYHDIDFVSLASKSTLLSTYQSEQKGVAEVTTALNQFVTVKSISIIGARARKLNKFINVIRSTLQFKAYDELFYSHPIFSAAIKESLSQNSYDVIYVDTVGLMRSIPNVGLPVILNHHNIESEMLSRRASKAGIIGKLIYSLEAMKMKRIERKYAPSVQLNITCSELDSKRLQKIAACKAECIPNGVDMSYFKRTSCYDISEVEGIIFIGGLDWYPNADAMEWFASDIYPVIAESIGEIKVDIIGRGTVNGLSRLASSNKSVKAHGFVDDILPFMEKASVYVCPIRDGGGTKLKVLDALAMGVPLVAHPVACEGINVTDGKDVLFASTPIEFAKQINRIINEKGLGEKLSQNGIDLIDKYYSYRKIGEKFGSCVELLGNIPRNNS
ncbi:glycosyltransferase family 4 protein [Reinekea sp.]|jgi:glycosyltransferase involved in cell wall biosynthesis|uniref:glycosyltransferase family 4 protein n=1 Tax=Reinekea sp. TaxID=1970455 RepID=UPI0039898F47